MEQKNQISFDIKQDVAQGTYSNLAIITHSPNEFILDFASMLPGMPKAVIGSRVVMAPEHAKKLLMALQDNIVKYENQFGTIEMNRKAKDQGNTINFGDFGPFNNGTKS